MSVALSAIQTEVAALLQIDSGDVDKFQVEETVNRAQNLLLNILPATLLNVAIRTKRGNLFINEGAVQNPSDLIRLLKLWVDYDNAITDVTNKGYAARLVDYDLIDQFTNLDQIPTQIFPIAALSGEGGWELRPVPDGNVTEGWKMKYIYQLPTIASGQVCLLDARLLDLLIFCTTSYSAAVNNYSMERSSYFWDKFLFELTNMAPNVAAKVRSNDGHFRNFVNYQELLRTADRG